MNRVLLRLGLVSTLFLASAPAAAVASADAGGAIGLSRDGRHWSGDLADPLFDPATLWVPGDVREATFYVRNQADEGASLSVDLRGGATGRLLEGGDVRIDARVADGAWTSVSHPGSDSSDSLTAAAVPRGASERVQVRVSYGTGAVDAAPVRRLRLDVDVRLTQELDGATAEPAAARLPSGSSAAALPDVGWTWGDDAEGGEGDVLLGNTEPAGLRALLLLAAAALIILVRQARNDDEETPR